MSSKAITYAPGARVIVRDAEWLVRRVDRTSSGAQALNRKDATYLWRLNATEEELRADRNLLRREFAWVEQEITIISDEGRDSYRKDAHENFHLVRHEYEKEDGFATWKMRLHQILDGEGEV